MPQFRFVLEKLDNQEWTSDAEGNLVKDNVYWVGTIRKGAMHDQSGHEVTGLEAAKQDAQDSLRGHTDDEGDSITIVWKPAPKEWDAECVSQWIEEMYPDLPTD